MNQRQSGRQQYQRASKMRSYSQYFEAGRALFQRLKQNQLQEYINFRELKEEEMMTRIIELSTWKDNGAQSKFDKVFSALFVQSLIKFKKQKFKERSNSPELFTTFVSCLQSFWSQDPKLKHQEGRKVTQFSESSSQVDGQLHNLSDKRDRNADSEEEKPLKWE